ncbi:hypothetical protein [Bacillus solimangrovi]|uniref:Uncharacterized protein n=1 Tax=Bacillus solimangrovi TaxID=1305675 RepID=A0A1E5LFD7_9BACI|nr:hypothetical protein [Bacillus solimangrovi]OEH92780.1 hypothetical protein BFG57_01940 [Bacillus solimangrovi]
MNSWIALLKKDFLLMKNRLLVFLLLDVMAFASGWYFYLSKTNSGQQPHIDWMMNEYDFFKFIPLFITIVVHVFFIGTYILMSLNKERKQLHLWLHNPQSAYMLLGSKLVNGVIAAIMSLSLIGIFLIINFTPYFSELTYYFSDFTKLLFYLFSHLILTSLFLSVCFMFFWTVYHMFKTRIGKWSILSIIVFIFLFFWSFSRMEFTDLYAQMVLWGEYSIDIPKLVAIENFGQISFEEFGTIGYLGEDLFHTLLGIVLFVLSAWMIEKKVEV